LGAVQAEAERVPPPDWQTRKSERAGRLDEASPAFLTGREEGRKLDLRDAASIALGEEDDAQTEP